MMVVLILAMVGLSLQALPYGFESTAPMDKAQL